MRLNSKLITILMIGILFVLLGVTNQPSHAEPNALTIGPWTFDLADFGDQVSVLDTTKKIRVDTIENCTGTELELGAQRFQECLNLTLAGYTPNSFFVNVGTSGDTASNWFQVDFTDVKAENHFGPDIVFFECHFGDNSYDIAVRPEGQTFTDFVTFSASNFINPEDPEGDDLCNDGGNRNWGLQINLSDFGLPNGTIVDALQFKVIDPDPGDPNIGPEGEPSMVAVLSHAVVIPAIHLPLIFKP